VLRRLRVVPGDIFIHFGLMFQIISNDLLVHWQRNRWEARSQHLGRITLVVEMDNVHEAKPMAR